MNETRIEGAAAALAAHSKDAAAAGAPNTKPGIATRARIPGGDGADPLDQAQATAEQAGATISDAAAKIGTAASDLGTQAYDRTVEAADYVGQAIKQQPLASVLIGVATGYVLAFLIHRQPREPEPRSRRRAEYAPRR